MRAYWVEITIVAVAVIVMVVGFTANHPVVEVALPSSGPVPTLVAKKLPGTTIFSLDTVSSPQGVVTLGGMDHHTVSAKAGMPITVAGWAVDGPAGASAAAIVARIAGAPDISAQYGIDRADVGRALSNAQFVKSGFSIVVPGAVMTAGNHSMSLLIYAHNGSGYWLSPGVLDLDVK